MDDWNVNVIIKGAMGISYLMLTIFSPTYHPCLKKYVVNIYTFVLTV